MSVRINGKRESCEGTGLRNRPRMSELWDSWAPVVLTVSTCGIAARKLGNVVKPFITDWLYPWTRNATAPRRAIMRWRLSPCTLKIPMLWRLWQGCDTTIKLFRNQEPWKKYRTLLGNNDSQKAPQNSNQNIFIAQVVKFAYAQIKGNKKKNHELRGVINLSRAAALGVMLLVPVRSWSTIDFFSAAIFELHHIQLDWCRTQERGSSGDLGVWPAGPISGSSQ